MARKARKRAAKGPKDSTTAKGKIAEQITAMMHDVPGVRVDRNVAIAAADGSGRTREFDVVLASQVAGYGVRFAIQCKNYAKPVGVQKIDEFIGALEDVGIPTQYAIYVSVSGYTGGAVQRARAAGIKTLTLTGLSKDRLKAHVAEASQNVIFLVPRMIKISVFNKLDELEDQTQLYFLYDEEGNHVGFLPDLLWRAWMEGRVPLTLGEHEVDLDVPDRWHNVVNGEQVLVMAASATVVVSAAVVSFAGRVEQHSLLDASDGTTSKYRANASFDTARSEYPVTNFYTESKLQKFLDERSAAVRVTVGRIKVPRIIVGHINWPPSERVVREVREIKRRHERGEFSDPTPLLKNLYQGELGAMFEPIFPDHPMLRTIRPGNPASELDDEG